MARSMIRRRQEAERERIEAYCATLRHAATAPRRRPPPDFATAIAEARKGFGGLTIRDPEAWHPRLKTRDPARLRLAAARHLYARYPVPAALERVWLDASGLDPAEAALRKRWYIVAAGGGSLYKACAGQWLTRKEVHAFLDAADDLSFGEAFWYAIARGFTDDTGAARRIARSKIARMPRAELGFWREAARFFCACDASLAEIDDLCDYLAACLRRDRGFSLKGRTLVALRRRMEDWHRDLAEIRRIEAARMRAAARDPAGGQEAGGGRWRGSALQDWSWKPSHKEAAARGEWFSVVQLCTAAELVNETRAMHHCVSTYAGKCIAGYASIWSLRRHTPGRVERLLTIELDQRHRVVQVRGFANRPAHPAEEKVLARWAKARGIVLPG